MAKTPSTIDKINTGINVGCAALVGGIALGVGAYLGGPSVMNYLRETKADLLHREPKDMDLISMERKGQIFSFVGVDSKTRQDTTRIAIEVMNADPIHNRLESGFSETASGYIQTDVDDNGQLNSVDILEKSWRSNGAPHVSQVFTYNKQTVTSQEDIKAMFHPHSHKYPRSQGAFFFINK